MVFKDDIIRKYADKRKALEYKDVEDLLNCLVKFMQAKQNDDVYAFRIPSIGVMYRPIYLEDDKQSDKRFHTERVMMMLKDVFFNENFPKERTPSPLMQESKLEKLYGEITNEELQDFQNNLED